MGCFVGIALWAKTLYYLSLVNRIAPLVLIIFKIFYAIGSFMLILVTCLLVGAVSLWLLGRDQVQYDQIPVCPPGAEEGCGAPDHADFGGAVKAMVYVALGEVGVQGDFGLGTGGTGPALWALFIGLSFFLIIHMMNMLVAVMGNT